MTVLALILRKSPPVGLFCPSRFRNGSMESPGSAKPLGLHPLGEQPNRFVSAITF
jgi:hypothetical protein